MMLRMGLTGTGRKRLAVWHGQGTDSVEPLETVNDPLTIYALALIVLQNRDAWHDAGWHTVFLEDLGRNRRVWSASVEDLHTLDPDAVIAWVSSRHQQYAEEAAR